MNFSILLDLTSCIFYLTILPSYVSQNSSTASHDTFLIGSFSQKRSYENANLIAGGFDVKEKQFPFIVYFRLPQGRLNKKFCAGTIFNRRIIITALHCISNYNALRGLRVFAGSLDNHVLSPHTQVRHVQFLYGPDGFSDLRPTGESPDIALLVLEQPLDFNEYVQPIDILERKQAKEVEWATVAGWGRVSNNFLVEPVNTMLYTEVKQLPSKLCHSLYQKDPSYLCFGDPRGGRGPCFGDSGGPLVVFDHRVKAWKQLGIISLVPCEDGNQMGFYTDLTKLQHWVESHTTFFH